MSQCLSETIERIIIDTKFMEIAHKIRLRVECREVKFFQTRLVPTSPESLKDANVPHSARNSPILPNIYPMTIDSFNSIQEPFKTHAISVFNGALTESIY